MGLASQFGNDAYVCKSCGAKLAAFAPHCPHCLGKNLAPINKVSKQQQGPLIQGIANPDEASRPANPVASFLVVAVLVAFLGYGAYVYFNSQKEPAPVAETPKAEPARPVVKRVVKHVATKTVPKTRPAATVGTAPRKAPPMRLWENSSDSED